MARAWELLWPVLALTVGGTNSVTLLEIKVLGRGEMARAPHRRSVSGHYVSPERSHIDLRKYERML